MALRLGVQSQLGEKAVIYYSHHFKARSVGRVSDLIAACLKEKGLDPLALRGSILYALYIGYCVSEESLDTTLTPPNFSLEVGFDEKKIAVSLSVHLNEKQIEALRGLKAAVDSMQFNEKLEKHLFELAQFSESLEIRHFQGEKTFELLFFLSVDRKAAPTITWTEAPHSEKSDCGTASYIELGDIDYLKELGIYISGTPLTEAETRFAGFENPALDEIKITGKLENGLDSTRVSGKAPAVEQSTMTFKADAKNENDSYRVSSGNTGKQGDDTAALHNKINELQNAVANVERERDSLKEKLASSKIKPKEESAFGLLKSVWPFKKEEPKELEAERIVVFKSSKEENQSLDETSMTIKGSGSNSSDDKTVIAGSGEDDESDNLKDSSSTLLFTKLKEFTPLKEGSGFRKVLVEMEKNGDAGKQKEWREVLKSEMNAEKLRINEIVKELGRQTRQRENDFLSKERTAAAELRKKEETIRQKETLIQQKSEQLAQANMNMERLKGAGSNAEEQGFKLKLSNSQKLLQMKEDENKQMLKKMNDLENKIMVAQSKSSGGVDPQLVAKLQSSEKRVEEFKRMNQRLTDSLQKAQEKRESQESSESKRQVEAIERQFSDTKKNLEKTSQKLKEVQEVERKLHIELGKIQEENKKLKASLNRAGTPGEDEVA